MANCTKCSTELKPGAAFCPQCGTVTDSSGGSASPASGNGAFKFDLGRLSNNDKIAVGGTFVAFIGFWLPWFSANFGLFSVSINGWSSHFIVKIAVLDTLVILGYFVMRAGWDKLPIGGSFAHAPVLFILTAANFGLILLGSLWGYGGASSFGIGAIIAIIGSAAAAAPTAIPAIKSMSGSK